MHEILTHKYENIISIENLLGAWKEFIRGKRNRKDVQDFQFNLMTNIISLHKDLTYILYTHGPYEFFKISDPKPRNIHKATVRDRLLHHALYRQLYMFFDNKFIHDSYSCRLNKGTHKAINRLKEFSYKVSRNHTKTAWTLKCDIKKFFASIDQEILMNILEKHISDRDTIWLLNQIISSFNSGIANKGLPLGNLTSQLLVNIYMNKFDQFVKHKIKIKYYIRYADDFVIMHQDRDYLLATLFKINTFLGVHLKLTLHPNKVFVKTISSGVDFLGWVHFPKHRILRTNTKKRMLNKFKYNLVKETIDSYKGLLKHGNAYKLLCRISNLGNNSI